MSLKTRKIKFGAELRKARLKLGLNQRQLGEPAGVTDAMVSEIERGKRAPSLFVAQDMAKTLDISLDKLLS